MRTYSLGGVVSSPRNKYSAQPVDDPTPEIANHACTTADDGDKDGEHDCTHCRDIDGAVNVFGKSFCLEIPGLVGSDVFSTAVFTVDSGREAEIASLVLCKAAALSPR
jgi:hypothetical protein